MSGFLRDLEKHDTMEMAHHLKLMNKAYVSMAHDLSMAKSAQEFQYEKIKDTLTVSDDKSCSLTREMNAVKDTGNTEDVITAEQLFRFVHGWYSPSHY